MANSEVSIANVSTQSRTPWGLEVLQCCQRCQDKTRLYFGVGELDDIAAGKHLDLHLETILDGTWIDDVLPRLNWWITIAGGLGNGRSHEFRSESDDTPELKEFRQNVVSMVGEILTLYPAALDSVLSVSAPESLKDIRGLDMMKKYREFTLYVRDFAYTVWPDKTYEISWLWNES